MNTQQSEIEVQRVSVFSLKDSSAIFLCCGEKTILIQTEAGFFEDSAKAMQRKMNPRPQTHELLAGIFRGFEISLEKILVCDVRDGIFFAKIFCAMKNELGEKRLEIDSRPSDAIMQSFFFRTKVFVAKNVFDTVEDATPLLKKIQEREASKNA